MIEPRVIPREAHSLSRRDIDPDALKVLYRLREGRHIAYLVGGSVRDLLLGRRPKDFDVGTSAHPHQVKKLFRNCWIIGRRFRLAHVKFGPKVIEVATFRRQVQPGEEIVQDGVPAAPEQHPTTPPGPIVEVAAPPVGDAAAHGSPPANFHHDNTFGTPEEDAFRRDFTINALFYDIATFSIIDYVGGLDDLRAGIIRSIGDPMVRFQEDPVRMMRAVAIASRLDFSIDQPILDAIAALRHEIGRAAPPRMVEEYYKILRSGSAKKTFQRLAEVGLLEPVSVELQRGATDALWRSLNALDDYRKKFTSVPDTLTNPILLGCLLTPLGLAPQGGRPADVEGRKKPPAEKLGSLPLARRDIERLRQLLSTERRLHDLAASPRTQRGLTHRGSFRDALTWLEIHGDAPDLVEHWITVLAERGSEEPVQPAGEGEKTADGQPHRRRRRRRRRRFRPAP
jgi:poly(A) polymerase